MRNDQLYIYIVDDSESILNFLRVRLRTEFGFRVRTFYSAEECLNMIEKRQPDMVISDFYLDPINSKGMNGDALLAQIKNHYPNLPVIMYSSSKDMNLIVDMMKKGALDFISRSKNFEPRLIQTVSRSMDKIKEKHDRKLVKRGITISLVILSVLSIVGYYLNPDLLNYILIGMGVAVFIFILINSTKLIGSRTGWLKYIGHYFTISLKKEFTIFIVEDSEVYRIMITKALDDERQYLNPIKYNLQVFSSAEKCLQQMHMKPDILILDYMLDNNETNGRGMNGLQLLGKIKESSPDTEVVMISAQKDLEVVAKLIREGAKDYIEKDILWQHKMKLVIHKIIMEHVRKSGVTKTWLIIFVLILLALLFFLLF